MTLPTAASSVITTIVGTAAGLVALPTVAGTAIAAGVIPSTIISQPMVSATLATSGILTGKVKK